MKHMSINLLIKKAPKEDVYKDIIRIPEKFRLDSTGKLVPEGSVCRIFVGKKDVYALMRGTDKETGQIAYIDERQRNMLKIKPGKTVDITIKKVGCIGQFRWALHASDPAYRIAAKMALLSIILGTFGLALGIVSLF